MLVLGIDPGIATTGYGFVKTNPAGNPELVAYGVLSTSATSSTSMRLTSLYDQVRELIRQYQPDACALEKLFFQKNIKTAMTVSEARGVISLCISQAGFEPAEYTPPVKLNKPLHPTEMHQNRRCKRWLNLSLKWMKSPNPMMPRTRSRLRFATFPTRATSV